MKLRKLVLWSTVNSLGFIPARNKPYEIGARTKPGHFLYLQSYEQRLKTPEQSN
jgi:hypothetical protein